MTNGTKNVSTHNVSQQSKSNFFFSTKEFFCCYNCLTQSWQSSDNFWIVSALILYQASCKICQRSSLEMRHFLRTVYPVLSITTQSELNRVNEESIFCRNFLQSFSRILNTAFFENTINSIQMPYSLYRKASSIMVRNY